MGCMGLLLTNSCRFCGQEFGFESRRGTRPAYCSDRCRAKNTRKLREERLQSTTERRCPRCGETKQNGEFAGVTHPYCRPCHAAYARVLRANKTPEQRARVRLQETAWRQGITVEALLALVEAQAGLCAICKSDLNGDTRRWHVDHDHGCCPNTSGDGTGKRQRGCGKCVRGVLCGNCNVGLGMFRENVEVLRSAITYLTSSGS